jgi:hypothetical protein
MLAVALCDRDLGAATVASLKMPLGTFSPLQELHPIVSAVEAEKS